MNLKRKLAIALLTVCAAVGPAALLTPVRTQAKGCPRNSHLVTCSTYSFCCPNNALCVCL